MIAPAREITETYAHTALAEYLAPYVEPIDRAAEVAWQAAIEQFSYDPEVMKKEAAAFRRVWPGTAAARSALFYIMEGHLPVPDQSD